jgi:hypothetical protein
LAIWRDVTGVWVIAWAQGANGESLWKTALCGAYSWGGAWSWGHLVRKAQTRKQKHEDHGHESDDDDGFDVKLHL